MDGAEDRSCGCAVEPCGEHAAGRCGARRLPVDTRPVPSASPARALRDHGRTDELAPRRAWAMQSSTATTNRRFDLRDLGGRGVPRDLGDTGLMSFEDRKDRAAEQ